jgi:hypothetical protein
MIAAFAVKAALLDLLEKSAAGRYQVAGVQKRKLDAEDVRTLPLVTVYYERGNFPEHKSSINGPYQHEAAFRVDIVTAAVAEMDLTPIISGGPPEQIAAALAAKTDAEAIADAKAEETAGILFDIIMRPENRDFGLDYNPGRWITGYTKGNPQTSGAIVILAGYFTITCQVPEYTTQETGRPGTTVSHRLDLSPDTGGDAKEGVTVDAPPVT